MSVLFGTGYHEPPRPTMKLSIQGGEIPLAFVCHECGGSKNTPHVCIMCDGAGEVPTTQGLILLAFAKKFLPWVEKREEKAKGMMHKEE